jgi:DNA-directed RNA polymerase subunit RPC12/RpoP
MIPLQDCVYKCDECGEEVTVGDDKNFPLLAPPSKCPKCGGKMTGGPVVRDRPSGHPFKKY